MDLLIKIFYWSDWDWNGWQAISTIVLTITIILIAIQAYATRKLAKITSYSIIPNVSFFLRSAKTQYNRLNKRLDLELPDSWKVEEKLKTLFIIKNRSESPILFKVKITYEINKKRRLIFNHYWKNPLPPDGQITQYPDIIHLKNFIEEIDSIKGKKIVAHIEYAYGPIFAPEVCSETILQTWTFDLNKYEWIGPGGIRDIMIFLPGERQG